MSILGIDLGTNGVKMAYINDEGRPVPIALTHNATIPSDIYFKGDSILFGSNARNYSMVDPANGISFWKRHMGTDDILYTAADNTKYRARDCAKIVLEYIKESAEQHVGVTFDTAVVATPANYSDSAKEETVQAIKDAGFLSSQFADNTPVLISEPQAAALALLGAPDKLIDKDGTWIFVDIGCGTSDIILIKKEGSNFRVLDTQAIPKLGGLDYTNTIAEFAVESFKKSNRTEITHKTHPDTYARLIEKAEDAKLQLNRDPEYPIPVTDGTKNEIFTLSAKHFADLVSGMNEQIIECVKKLMEGKEAKDHGLTAKDITIIPIGGGSLCLALQKALESNFTVSPCTCDPFTLTALGAALHGWEQAGGVSTPGGLWLPPIKMTLTDVLHKAVGIIALNRQGKEEYKELFHKNTPFNTRSKDSFKIRENDPGVKVKIVHSETGTLDEIEKIGEMILDNLTPSSSSNRIADVEFYVDKHGVFHASVKDRLEAKETATTINYNKN